MGNIASLKKTIEFYQNELLERNKIISRLNTRCNNLFGKLNSQIKDDFPSQIKIKHTAILLFFIVSHLSEFNIWLTLFEI
jgi:hypothetical protein